jgi:hypothetical protein
VLTASSGTLIVLLIVQAMFIVQAVGALKDVWLMDPAAARLRRG